MSVEHICVKEEVAMDVGENEQHMDVLPSTSKSEPLDNAEHQTSTTAPAENIKCKFCSFRTVSYRSLQLHELKHDSSSKRFRCSHCNVGFTRKLNLINHLRVHNGIKPYKCTQCSYETAYNNNLSIHFRRKHSKERPFKCPKCPYSCVLKSFLKQHMKSMSHYDRQCSICGEVTESISDYLDHLSEHVEPNSTPAAPSPLKETWNAPVTSQTTNPTTTIPNLSSFIQAYANGISTDTATTFQRYLQSKAFNLPNNLQHMPYLLPAWARLNSISNSLNRRIKQAAESDSSFACDSQVMQEPEPISPSNDTVEDEAAQTQPACQEMVSSSNEQSSAVPSTSSTAVNFHCVHCDITFHDSVLYSIHRGTHGYNDPFTCNYCGKNCVDKYIFSSHFHACNT